MRLTIFWRVIFAQLTLIALILGVSLYAFSQLHHLASLSTDILATDSASIEAENRLLKIWLLQMRSAEKYALLRDDNLYKHFVEGSNDFTRAFEKVMALVHTPEERALLEEIRDLYGRYATGLKTAFTPNSAWARGKTEISEKLIAKINELIRFREEMIAQKTVTARDQAVSGASTVGWVSLGGIAAAPAPVPRPRDRARACARPWGEASAGAAYPNKVTLKITDGGDPIAEDFVGWLDALAERRLDLRPLVSAVAPFTDDALADAFRAMLAGDVIRTVVSIDAPAPGADAGA